jgi:hypothetical protein
VCHLVAQGFRLEPLDFGLQPRDLLGERAAPALGQLAASVGVGFDLDGGLFKEAAGFV